MRLAILLFSSFNIIGSALVAFHLWRTRYEFTITLRGDRS